MKANRWGRIVNISSGAGRSVSLTGIQAYASAKAGGTTIEPFETWGPLGRRSGIDAALEESEERLPISQRMLRGDFDA